MFALTLFLMMGLSKIQAQLPEGHYKNFEDLLETLVNESDESGDQVSLIEELQLLNQNRIDINTCNAEELMKIPFLNEVTAGSITGFRQKYGRFYSVYELASVPGIGKDLAEKISFFIVADKEGEKENIKPITRGRVMHQVLIRSGITIPFASGYRADAGKPPTYPGSPASVYTRYHFEKKDKLEAGITAEKDPGEPFFKSPSKSGFDFYSGHLAFRVNDKIPAVIIGDYLVRSGQGLVCWQGFSLGRSPDVMQASKNMSRLTPYTSTDENKFFRGVAGTVKTGKSSVNLFLSLKKRDANLSLGDDSSAIFTSLQNSGYHRTSSETEDKNSILQMVTGIFASHGTRTARFGITALYEKFQYPFVPGNQLYEKFYFNGRENFNAGADYHFVSGRYHLFGEAAIAKSGGVAAINGIEAFLHDQLSVTLLFRHFGKTYQSTWAQPFSTDSRATGETGIYAGIRLLPVAKIEISAYSDWFYWPWIKYTTASPSIGSDSFIQCDIRYNRRLTGYLRYTARNREGKISEGNLYLNSSEASESLRFHCKYDYNGFFSFCWRSEWKHIKNKNEKGLLLYQDVIWTPERLPFSANFRISWFKTTSFDSRIFTYESDLLYAFSSFSFSGEGFRCYLKTKYQWKRKMEIWFKTGMTWYPDQENISSGKSELESNLKTEIKIQIRYRF